MNIKLIYLASANMDHNTHIRVFDQLNKEIVFSGSYRVMPDEVRKMKVVAFDFDNDLTGCVFTAVPA